MMAFRLVWKRSLHCSDTRAGPPLHKPNRLGEIGRATEESPGITLRLPRGPPASAGPRNISQAYGKRADGGFQHKGCAERKVSTRFDGFPTPCRTSRWQAARNHGFKAIGPGFGTPTRR